MELSVWPPGSVTVMLNTALYSGRRGAGVTLIGVFKLLSVSCESFFVPSRAAAYSKLGNYAGAVRDCERAIGIDPNYSKAYGRMG